MLRNGFILTEIATLTLAQLKMYSKAIAKQKRIETINAINVTRAGYHANEDEYKEIMRQLTVDD